MKSKVLWLVITGIILFSVVFMSCTSETTSTSTTSTNTQTSVETTTSGQTSGSTTSVTTAANWWDKWGEPEYGGTISILNGGILSISFNNNSLVGSGDQWWLEGLFSNNIWTLDRSEFNYSAGFIPPEYMQGILVESWEQTDPQTMIMHIRQGVHWQDKAPVNGREFTANDVVAHYNRVLGMGDGYTTKSATYVSFTKNWKSVVAVDEYTVELTFNEPVGILGFMGPMEGMSLNAIEAPEWAALANTATGNENPLEDWHNAVGTGAWMLTNYVSNSVIEYSRNPDYWGYDERHQENQLPYADTIKKILIQDSSTQLAALRTGKIDTMGVSTVQYQALLESNPELVFVQGTPQIFGLTLRVDKEPFTDVRVRTALQMALDTDAIAELNMVENTPCGLISPVMTGFCYAYTDWSQSLKDEYKYNVSEAKNLLTQAGYPNGFDTSVLSGSDSVVANYEIMKAYLADIGVNMEIKIMDSATMRQYVTEGKQEGLLYGQGGMSGTPPNVLARVDATNNSLNIGRINDTTVQEVLAQINLVATTAEVQALMQKVDKLSIEQHWYVSAPGASNYTAMQPSLKGFSGVEGSSYYQGGWLYSRLWTTKNE